MAGRWGQRLKVAEHRTRRQRHIADVLRQLKDADLAIFNGHPFSPYARVEMTLIDGQIFFDRERDVKSRIPWKEEYEPETPATRPTDGEEIE